jgi:hypothetical protein
MLQSLPTQVIPAHVQSHHPVPFDLTIGLVRDILSNAAVTTVQRTAVLHPAYIRLVHPLYKPRPLIPLIPLLRTG